MPTRTHSGTSVAASSSNRSASARHEPSALTAVREPQHQPVAEVLHDAASSGSVSRTDVLLTVEQRERFAVAVLGGELREPDDVGEDHRALGRFAHRSTTWMFPLSVFTLISPSSPARTHTARRH